MTSRIAGHLQRLCVEIGERPIGSRANHAAQQYLDAVLASLGFDVEVQEYPCPAWQDRGTTLLVDGRWVAALANPFTGPCDVTAPVVPLATFEALEQAELDGALALLYGDLTRAPLAPAAWFLAGERDRAIPRLLAERGAKAVITVPPVMRETERVIEDADFPLPSATVPGLDAALLLGASVAQLRIEVEAGEGTTANVVARAGCTAGGGEPRVVVCAHYDTKVDTPGATDNGSGVAVLLDVAARLAGAWSDGDGDGDRPALGVELVAFTGEEYLPIGDDEYLRRRGGDLSDVVACINVDGAGHVLDVTTVMETSGGGPLREALERAVAGRPEVVWVEPWPESNHSTFSMRGVPAAAFSSPQARELSHLRTDTVAQVSVARLAEIAEVIDDVVRSMPVHRQIVLPADAAVRANDDAVRANDDAVGAKATAVRGAADADAGADP